MRLYPLRRATAALHPTVEPLAMDGVSWGHDASRGPMTMRYPSYTRYYWGCIAIGMVVGITWTALMLGTLVQRYITRTHALTLLYSVAAILMVTQIWMLVRWNKQLKADRLQRITKAWPGRWPDEDSPEQGEK